MIKQGKNLGNFVATFSFPNRRTGAQKKSQKQPQWKNKKQTKKSPQLQCHTKFSIILKFYLLQKIPSPFSFSLASPISIVLNSQKYQNSIFLESLHFFDFYALFMWSFHLQTTGWGNGGYQDIAAAMRELLSRWETYVNIASLF